MLRRIGARFLLANDSLVRLGTVGFKSAYSLDRLYEDSNAAQGPGVPTMPADPQTSEFNGFIPLDKLEISYARSGGPGGQHANTTNSRAAIRFKVSQADWIPNGVRERFAEKFAHRITKEGDMIVRSERTRIQALNLADCLDKLRFSVRECLEELSTENRQPSLEVEAKLKKRAEAADKNRLLEKKKRSEKRKQRSGDTS